MSGQQGVSSDGLATASECEQRAMTENYNRQDVEDLERGRTTRLREEAAQHLETILTTVLQFQSSVKVSSYGSRQLQPTAEGLKEAAERITELKKRFEGREL